MHNPILFNKLTKFSYLLSLIEYGVMLIDIDCYYMWQEDDIIGRRELGAWIRS